MRAEIAVVGNSNNKSKTLEPGEVQDIYMGRRRSFPDGSMAIPLDQEKLRPDFYLKLTHRPIEQINAYWARIMFSGQASPPTILSDDKEVIQAITENPGAIGYISTNSVNSKLRVLMIIK